MLKKRRNAIIIVILLLGVGAALWIGKSIIDKKADLKNVEQPQFTSDGIRALSIVNEGKEIFSIFYNPQDYKNDFDYWEIAVPYDGLTCTNTEEMDELYKTIAGMNFTNPIDLDKTIDTGIAKTENKINLEFVSSGQTDTIDTMEISENVNGDSKATILIGNQDVDGNYYVAIEGYEDQVYSVSEKIITAALSIEPFKYILNISCLINIESITDVEINIGKEAHIIAIDDDTYTFDKKQVEKKRFTTLFQRIQFVLLDSNIEDKIDQSEDKEPVLSIVYNRNSKDAPKIEVSYYKLDDTYYSVKANNKGYFKVLKEEVDTLITDLEKTFQ
jgi:hypothetical protein